MLARITVKGFVQGVFYRLHTRKKATALGLEGYVRNKSDGSVEIVAQGDKERIEELLAWAGKGPSAARVEKAGIEWLRQESMDFAGKGFKIRYEYFSL